MNDVPTGLASEQSTPVLASHSVETAPLLQLCGVRERTKAQTPYGVARMHRDCIDFLPFFPRLLHLLLVAGDSQQEQAAAKKASPAQPSVRVCILPGTRLYLRLPDFRNLTNP